MSDYVTVANLALSKLGEDDQLTDPNDDTHAARSIRAVWASIRQRLLRRGKYNFSLSRAELASQSSSSQNYFIPYPFTARFPLPDGCLRLVEVIEPESVRASYKLERNAILADTDGPVWVLYVADVEEVGQWDGLFVEEFAAELAWQVSTRITGSLAYRESMRRDARKAKADAAGVDAKEDPPIETDESDWITARYS